MPSTRIVWAAAAVLAACGGGAAESAAAPGASTTAAEGPLIGGGLASAGIHDVPGPMRRIEADVAGGNALDADALGLGGDCEGWIMRSPDLIVRTEAGLPRLVYRLTPARGRPSLLVHSPDDEWHCAEAGPAPAVRVEGAPAGQYDVWIGSAEAAEPTRATLVVE